MATHRSSFAAVYVNGVYSGLYFMHEDISKDLAKSRFPGDGSGNLMQLYYNVHLGYFGADDEYYRNKVYVNDFGESFGCFYMVNRRVVLYTASERVHKNFDCTLQYPLSSQARR